MTRQLRARRSFYSDGRTQGRRRIIARGELFTTDDLHAQQLILKRIAEPAQATRSPEPVTGIRPSETQTIAPQQTQIVKPEETPQQAPEYLKQEEPPADLQPVQEVPQEVRLEAMQEEPQEAPQELNQDPAALSYQELKKAAKTAGIKGYNTMKKDDLIKNLREARKNGRN